MVVTCEYLSSVVVLKLCTRATVYRPKLSLHCVLCAQPGIYLQLYMYSQLTSYLQPIALQIRHTKIPYFQIFLKATLILPSCKFSAGMHSKRPWTLWNSTHINRHMDSKHMSISSVSVWFGGTESVCKPIEHDINVLLWHHFTQGILCLYTSIIFQTWYSSLKTMILKSPREITFPIPFCCQKECQHAF